MTSEDLAERLLDFAVRIGKVVDALPGTRLGTAHRGPVGSLRDVAGAQL